jgi:cell wall-associated NlpC family hydrolase
VFRVRSIIPAMALAVLVAAIQIHPAAAAQTESGAVENFAVAQISKPFQMGATGLSRYDCSGLVYRTYFETGLLKLISGRQRTARGYYNWFKDHGLITTDPRPGDLVVWAYKGRPVSHIGIFVGWNKKGQPMAISALINPYGVSRHRVDGISIPLKAYLRVNLTS